MFDPQTWENGIVPFAGCNIDIAPAITLIIPSYQLIIPLNEIQVPIGSTLQIGTTTTSTFTFPKNINVNVFGNFNYAGSTGSIQLKSSTNLLFDTTAIYSGADVTIIGTTTPILNLTNGITLSSISVNSNGTPSVVTTSKSIFS